MERKFRITNDTGLDSAICIHLKDGTIIMFKKWSRGLYHYDTTNMKHNTINIQVAYYNFLNIVESNKAYLHQREIKGTDDAIILQNIVGCTATQTLK